MDINQWKWNYYTLETISEVKCSICNNVNKPQLYMSEHLKNHLISKKADPVHTRAFLDYMSSLRSRGKEKIEFRWDSHYKIISSDIIFQPNVRCKHCEADIPVQDDQPIIQTPESHQHLKNDHKIQLKNWKAFQEWIHKYAAKDYGPNILLQQKKAIIKVDRCNKCNDEIRGENAIMFVKHLIDKHRQEIRRFLHPDIIPKELLVFDSNDDIPTDSPTNDGSSKVKSTSSDQPTTSRQQQSKTIDKTSEEPSFDPNAPSSSGYASEEPPSKRKSNSPPQTEKHPSKRKK